MSPRRVVIGAIVLLATFLQWSGGLDAYIKPAEHIVTDKVRQLLAVERDESRILVVDIDEASLASDGPWPWPRSRIADLVERLLDTYGAKVVGMDVIFPSAAEDGQSGNLRLAALGENGMVVYSQAFDFSRRENALQTGVPVFGDLPAPGFLAGEPLPATGFVANHVGLAQARCVGNIGLRPDDDGRVRRVPLLAQWQGRTSQLLPLAMLTCATRKGDLPSSVLPARSYPSINAASWEVPYAKQWTAYTVVSARDILSGYAPVDLLKGRWVLVGSSALGLNDRVATPLSPSTAGVMVHASVLTSLLDWQEGRSEVWPVDGRWLATIWVALTVPLLAWFMSRFRAWIILPAFLALTLTWLALVVWGLQHHLQFSILSPLLAYSLVMLMVPLEWWLLQREHVHTLRAFATYLAPTVLQQMLKTGVEHPLVPKYADITVVSADMQNYTGLTSQGSLLDAADLTREFLQCLTEPVLQQAGTLDKYTGDGLVAFWGAPLPNADHALCAIEAGCQIVLRVKEWNERRVRLGLPPARVRVGVETGFALVGDLGTKFRSTYTAVGDCINLASKLQSVARDLQTDLVIGPSAARAGASRGDLIPIANEQLPGTTQAVTLWTIKGLPLSLQASHSPALHASPLPS